jgi:hypothetical protein
LLDLLDYFHAVINLVDATIVPGYERELKNIKSKSMAGKINSGIKSIPVKDGSNVLTPRGDRGIDRIWLCILSWSHFQGLMWQVWMKGGVI